MEEEASLANVSVVELQYRAEAGERSGVRDLSTCKRALKKFFIESENDEPAFFQSPEVKDIKQLALFWQNAMNEGDIHQEHFKRFFKIFMGLQLTNDFYQKQFEEHFEHTSDLEAMQIFLKGFAESFALQADSGEGSPMLGGYLLAFVEHHIWFSEGPYNFVDLALKVTYFQPPRSPYHCDVKEPMCATVTEWHKHRMMKLSMFESVRLPLRSGAQIAAKAKQALEEVWKQCFEDDSEGSNGISPIHPLYSSGRFKPFDEHYAEGSPLDNYLGAVFHFALIDNIIELFPKDDGDLMTFTRKAIEKRSRVVPLILWDYDPYQFPANLLEVEIWFLTRDIQTCLDLVHAAFLQQSSPYGLLQSETVQGIEQMATFFHLEDLSSTLMEKHSAEVESIQNAAKSLKILNRFWKEKLLAAKTSADVEWVQHLLKQFADSFAVTADERDMNGGYAVPLVVLYDLENILEEFLKDVRVQGIEVSESVQEKVASRFPQLKMLGEGTTRLSHVFGKAAKGAFKGVWEACFTALDVKDFKPTRFYKDPSVKIHVPSSYLDLAFEHTGDTWIFDRLHGVLSGEKKFYAQVRKGFVHYEWFNPLEALEPMANPGEHVSEDQLDCARKLKQLLGHRPNALSITAAAQGMTHLARFLTAADAKKDDSVLPELKELLTETKVTEFDKLQKAVTSTAILIQWWADRFEQDVSSNPQKPLGYLKSLLFRFLHTFAVHSDEARGAMSGGFTVPLAAMERELPLFGELLATEFGKTDPSPGAMWARNNEHFNPSHFEQEAINAIRACYEVCIPGQLYPDQVFMKPLVDEIFAWSVVDTRQALLEQIRKAEDEYNWKAPQDELLHLLPKWPLPMD